MGIGVALFTTVDGFLAAGLITSLALLPRRVRTTQMVRVSDDQLDAQSVASRPEALVFDAVDAT